MIFNPTNPKLIAERGFALPLLLVAGVLACYMLIAQLSTYDLAKAAANEAHSIQARSHASANLATAIPGTEVGASVGAITILRKVAMIPLVHSNSPANYDFGSALSTARHCVEVCTLSPPMDAGHWSKYCCDTVPDTNALLGNLISQSVEVVGDRHITVSGSVLISEISISGTTILSAGGRIEVNRVEGFPGTHLILLSASRSITAPVVDPAISLTRIAPTGVVGAPIPNGIVWSRPTQELTSIRRGAIN